MGRALSAHKIWGRSYVWYRLWVDLAQIRGLLVGVDRGRYDYDDEVIAWQRRAAEPTEDAAGIVAYHAAQRARGEQYSEHQDVGETADDAIALD